MAGTVSGTFDLNVGPAVRGVREYRREAARADAQTIALGASLDEAFGRDVDTRIRGLNDSVKDMSSVTRQTRMEVRREWASMRRDIGRETTQIHRILTNVQQHVRSLGREVATPRIDLQGFEEAIGRVEALHARLNALGRRSATPRVGVRQTGAVGGGGGFGSAAARARGGFGGGGGGRGGGGVLRSIGTGPLNLGGGAAPVLLGLGLPLAQVLGGAAFAGASSLGAAGLGAGAAGGAGLATVAVGIAGIAAVAAPAAARMKEATDAQTKLTDAIRLHGRRSDEARAAQVELNHQLAGEIGLRRALAQTTGFGREWRRATMPGRRDFYGGVADVAQIGRAAIPFLSRAGNRATGAARGAAVAQAGFLTGRESQQTVGIFSRAFARDLPVAERTLENVERTMFRLLRASRPFFEEGLHWTEDTTRGWARSSRDIDHVRDNIGKMVDSTKAWAHLTGTTFDLITDLARAGRPSGDSMVGSLDRTFQRWDDWIERNPRRTRLFFENSVESVSKIASGLSHAVGWLNQMADLLRPLLDRFAQLVGLVSQLGLLGTPGALAALVGGMRGARGGLRGGGGGGGGGMILPMGGGGGGGFFGRGRANAFEAGRGRMLGARGGAFLMGPATIGPQAAIARRSMRGATGLGRIGAMFGEGRALGTAGRIGMAGLRGAGRAFWPLALGMTALDFASFQGSVGERAQAAASGATFGLINRPRTGEERADAAGNAVGTFIDRNVSNQPYTLGGTRRGLASVNTEIGRLQAANAATRTTTGMGLGGQFTRTDRVLSSDQRRENEQRIRLLRSERDELAATNRQMERRQQHAFDQRAIARAQEFGGKLPAVMGEFRRGGLTPGAAFHRTAGMAASRLGNIRDAGVETLGEASLAWARAAAKGHPKMQRDVDRLTEAIRKRFRKMGDDIAIVNGDILTGSRSEWRQIGQALRDPVERARQKVSDDFTAIQQKAVGSLTAMGFSRAESRRIVQGLEAGGEAGQVANANVRTGGRAPAARNRLSGIAPQAARARGGTIPGRGSMDTVQMGGGMVAPGETWIANRHTMADLSRATRAMYGFTAEQMIRGESRRHGYARGGMQRGGGLSGGIGGIASAVLGHFPGLSITSTTGGGHAAGSYHYRGMAVDISGAAALMNAAAAWVGRRYGAGLLEGIHNPNLSVKNGRTVPPSFWGASTWAQHANHIHLAAGGGGALGNAGVLGGGGGGIGRVHLRGLGRQQPGVPGVLRQRAGDIYARGLQRRVNRTLGQMGGGLGGGLGAFTGGGGDAAANMRLGRRMMIAAGWGADQWPALRQLWMGESGWLDKTNPSSGARGIPQALPASKMGAAAVGGDIAAQIRWGLGYIRGRYGSPSSALSAWNSRSPHWYARGGQLRYAGAFDRGGSFVTRGPTAFVAGEGPRNRRERVSITPANNRGSSGFSVVVAEGAVQVHVTAAGRDADAIAAQVGPKVAAKIVEALRKGTNGVVD